MVNLEEYTNRVKNLKISDVKQELLSVVVRGENLIANLSLAKANDININEFFKEYYVTKRLVKDANNAGFRNIDAGQIIVFGAQASKHIAETINKKYLTGNNTWDKSNVTVKQIAILNLLEHLNFFLKYSELLLDVAITNKSSALEPDKYLNKHDNNFLLNSLNDYSAQAVKLLGGSKAILKDIDEQPDIEVSDIDVEMLEATASPGLTVKNLGVHSLNPMYWISSMIANRRLKVIENARKKNEQFAMKITQAINKRNGEEDPELERLIEVYQNEIIKNEALIAEIEAKYA